MTTPRLRTGSIPLIAAVAVAVPVYWAFPQALSGWRSAAIVAAWAGCGLLAASLLLMLREPWLAERLGGLERMYAWHHRLGMAAYLALLAHPIALAADAWEEFPALAWAALAPWRQGPPGWLGWASLGSLMLGLAIALAPGLPYGAWRRLHWLLAAAVVLGFFHLALLGLDYPLLATPLLALAFIFWRVGRADLGLGARPYQVARVDRRAEGVVEATLRPLAAGITALPGQFVLVAFFDGPGFRGCREYHPFTLSAVAADGSLSLGIKALGDCTGRLQAVQQGVAARVQGPFGAFLAEGMERAGLWIAGGIGITPFLAALRSGGPSRPVRLIYLYRTPDDAAFLDELRALAARHPNLTLDPVASGDCPPDLPALLPPAAQLAAQECYLCGPPGLVRAAVALLAARGVGRERIHFERFDFR